MVKNIHESKFRKIGFTVSFFVLLILIIISFRMARDLVQGPHRLRVNFANVGTLILQEPVAMDGVQIGQVHKIEYTPGHAMVTLEFYRRIQLPEDSRIINFNHSLMGARMIFIYRGNSKAKMDFSKIQTGIFEEGIAEMLHKTKELLTMVQEYKNLAYRLQHGDDSTASVIDIYEEKLLPLITKYRNSLIDVVNMESYIVNRIGKIEKITNNFRNITKITGKNMKTVTGNSLIYLEKLDSLLATVDGLVDETGILVTFISKKDNALHDVVYKRDLFEKVVTLNNSLNKVVLILQAKGITEIINFWKNVHLLGTNPTKKKGL